MIFRIAFRNILRHKRRTFLSAITIAVGIMIFILMNSILTGTDRSMVDNMVHLSTGAIKMTTKTYDENSQTYPLSFGIDSVTTIQNKLRNDKRITGVAPRTQFLGQLSNYSETMPIIGIIIDPVADTSVFQIYKSISGSYFSGNSDRELLMGANLAKDLGVKAGDYITLYALTRYDSRNADEFLIKGVINSTDPVVNKSGVYITYKAADDFLDLEGLVTELDIAVHERLSIDAFMRDVRVINKSISSSYSTMAVKDFMEIGAAFFQVSKTKAMFGLVFMGIILLIAGVGIFNTVFMSVYERIREIGVLRAHGMMPGDINLLFILEGIITGVLGSTIGVVIGIAVNILLVVKGLPIDKMMGDIDTGDFPVWGTIYGTWNFDSLLFVFMFGIIVATIASIIPARTASRLEVTRALRFN